MYIYKINLIDNSSKIRLSLVRLYEIVLGIKKTKDTLNNLILPINTVNTPCDKINLYRASS